MKNVHTLVLLITLALLACAVSASLPGTKSPLSNFPEIKGVGGFHVGGREVVLSGLPQKNVTLQVGQNPRPYDPNGEFTTGQSYVHYMKLKSPSSEYPLILFHGGYSTGVVWEDTPDGRPGWMHFYVISFTIRIYFAQAGFDVYVADSVERGRSGWSQFPEINPESPLWANKAYAWNTFRVGTYGTSSATKQAYPGSRFPVDHFDQYHKQTVPRWTTSDDAIIAAYVELIDEVCKPKCVLLAHSQGGNFVYNVTIQRPEKVAAVIAVEPASAPAITRFTPDVVKNVKHFSIWGDYVNNVASWVNNKNITSTYRNYLLNGGVQFDLVEMTTDYGVYGNSHFLMVDDNSYDVADIVYTWMLNNSLVTERCPVKVDVVTTSSWSSNGVKESAFQLKFSNYGTKKIRNLSVKLEGKLESSYNLKYESDNDYEVDTWGNGIAAGATVNGQHGGIFSGAFKASIADCSI